MKTQFINATDIDHVWFALSDIAVSYSGYNGRKSSSLGDFEHREYLYTRAIHTIDDLLTDRAALNRAALRAIDFLSTALHALDKNKPHITADLVQRTLDDLLGATSAQRTFDH